MDISGNWTGKSARDIAGAVNRGDLSCEALWDLTDASIDAQETDIQAFVNLEDSGDRRDRLGSVAAGSGTTILAGLPVGIKDVFDTFDLPTEYGSPIYAGHEPRKDAVCVAQTRAAGAAIYAKTVTTEFASFFPGPTRNPHNMDYSPGGSSSGSAAAVAAGMLPLALGTQTGGSVIRPAAFCGIVGYKPSFNLIPTPGLKTFSWSLDTIGVFANSVDDAAFLVEAMTGRSLSAPSGKPIKIGVCRTPMEQSAEPETWRVQRQVADLCAKGGHTLEDYDLPEIFAEAHAAHNILNDGEGALSLMHERLYHRNMLSERLNQILDIGGGYKPQDFDQAHQTMKNARLALMTTWQDYDILLVPSAPGTAPKGQNTTGDSVFNRLWTAMGVPAITLPAGTGENGLPLGVQILAPSGQDADLIEAAKKVEAIIQAA